MKELGLYIHIPFCLKKCDYCDFISYCNKNNYIEKYIDSIKKEINKAINAITDEYQVTTIYIGGGTPSSIDSKYIVDILNTVRTVENDNISMVPEEITIEINPGTITEQKLVDYKMAGINRISIGLQETDNNLLNQIGRIHTYEQFLETYRMARKIGFHNINVDLMIGLPNQSIENIKQSLNKVINLNPEHISIYSLILEEGTKLYEKYQRKEIELPDEELERNMYWYVKNTLENNGYVHYEISNFAKTGYESKHNLNCWNQGEYIGVGVAAHSYINKIRYSNTEKLEEYLTEGDQKGSDPFWSPSDARIIHEIQKEEDMQKEYMLLGLRKIDGVSIQKFKNKFAQNPIFIFNQELKKLTEEGLIQVDRDNIKLTNRGLDLANLVWEEFV